MKECFRFGGLLLVPCAWALSDCATAKGPGFGDAWEDYYPYWYDDRADAFPYRNLVNFRYRDGSISAHFAHPRENGRTNASPLHSLYGIRPRSTDLRRRPAYSARYQVDYAVDYRRDYQRDYRANYRRDYRRD